MNRLIVLAGAPETRNLDWNEKQFLTGADVDGLSGRIESGGPSHAQWRRLATAPTLRERTDVPESQTTNSEVRDEADTVKQVNTFLGQDDLDTESLHGFDSGSSYHNSSSISTTSTELSDSLSEFYDHSFVLHKEVSSSQLSELQSATDGSNPRLLADQTLTSHAAALRTPVQWSTTPAPQPHHLSDLDDVPNATYLKSIEPQTMTVNLIVGILFIAQPRTVITGTKWGKGRETEVIELLVGDETKTGFRVTMWLPPEMHVAWKDAKQVPPDGCRSHLRRTLRLLRPRDVILLRNVALNTFRGKVHGQSLRRDVTKVDLLYRKKHDRDDVGGCYSGRAVSTASEADPQLMKVKRVRDWMVSFIADEEEASTQPRREYFQVGIGGGRRLLPPDTQ